ncbi:hypothetical protein [Spongiivirga citrea]|uniref:hypothetical protein n=1 Tax=Spongiivirga citrea TaxID=1481457 RepID=UPI0019545D0F|nr:hypothetical protein [Spongiivirga citrea]
MNHFDLILEFKEVIRDRIFITTATDQLETEIESNCWSLSLSKEQAGFVSTHEFAALLDLIKQNRTEQLNNSDYDVNLIFYLWFDEQAGQIRFNLINENHSKLPFTSKVEFAENQKIIISDFLESEYLNGIPFSELDEKNLTIDRENITKVYKELLVKE